ncbi:MAG TPA: HAMP domain-containing sensor histidine kinase [Candidatus Acidoferrales bacterium]|nr:HAMP domain-containing sensor histidine kinase [Candidatus Acidoferrales bacterium]
MAIIVLVLIPTIAVIAWPGEAPVSLLATSIAADIAAITAGIYVGGGADNTSGPLLYALLTVLAGLVLSEPANYLTAAGSALAYSTMVWAEQTKRLPHMAAYGKPLDDAAATVIVIDVSLFLVAWVASFAIRQMRAVYTRAAEMRGEAVSALSHDLKNPLTIIQGYAEMAGDAPVTARADYLRRIHHSAQQALDLVHNVLDAAALESRPMMPTYEPVRLNELVEHIAHFYELIAEGKGVEIVRALATDVPIIHGDRQLLGRAIGNLLSNAIKYAGHAGTVQVSTSVSATCVCVAVSDGGPGIAAADRAHLFEKFHRPNTAQGAEGTGLGLYIVACITEAHGGTVRVHSEPGRGSTFTIELPFRPSAA